MPGQDWGAHYTTNDFIQIRNQGFDHVRIPGGWNFYTGPAPDYTISNSYFAKEDFMVTNALNRGRPFPDTAAGGLIFPGPPPTPLVPAPGIGSYVSNFIADYNTVPADGRAWAGPCGIGKHCSATGQTASFHRAIWLK